MANIENKFTYLDSYGESQTIDIGQDDFALVQHDKIITDQAMKSKPTTFFKDAMKRFVKNKSSVVGSIILGILVLLAIILPSAMNTNITKASVSESFLEPKLFSAGTGWWDGCKTVNAAIDVDWAEFDQNVEEHGFEYAEQHLSGLPAEAEERYVVGGESGVTYSGISYADGTNEYGHGGYIRLNSSNKSAIPELDTNTNRGVSFDLESDFTSSTSNYKITVTTVDINDFESFSYGGECSYNISFDWTKSDSAKASVSLGKNIETYGSLSYTLKDFESEFRTAAGSDSLSLTSTNLPHLAITLNNASSENETDNLLIKSIVFSSDNADEATLMDAISMDDANETLRADSTTDKYPLTTLNGSSQGYRIMAVNGSYRLDTYEKCYGTQIYNSLTTVDFQDWIDSGWISADMSLIEDLSGLTSDEITAKGTQFLAGITFTDLGKTKCPLVLDDDHPATATGMRVGSSGVISFSCYVTMWKYLYPNMNSCPIFLFGTDQLGKDMLKYCFSGLRTSLLLGIITFAVCFTFGLIWGSIAGYFGGWVDIIMERFTDILGGVPWIVVMTIAIALFGNTFGVFVAALCLTGWIGTSSTTRTQFYRFKNREYVLASRTLGASDARLIFRHILPNAIGTLITSSVLMIPSIIFSEATLSYLQLGLTGLDSFGVILSDNQSYIDSYPFLVYFPSAIMALLMICFNLFGNGLRDAFNPSLKGSEN